MNNYNEYTVKISSEPSYYGSECTQQDADRVAESIGNLIRTEFPGIKTELSLGSNISGPDESVVEKINQLVENNWLLSL